MLELAEVAGIGVRELGSIERCGGNPSPVTLGGKRERRTNLSDYGPVMVRLNVNKSGR